MSPSSSLPPLSGVCFSPLSSLAPPSPSVRPPCHNLQPDRVMEFCQNNDLQLIIRAHECVMDGFERFAGGHLITLFSATNYCGGWCGWMPTNLRVACILALLPWAVATCAPHHPLLCHKLLRWVALVYAICASLDF